MLKEGYLVKAPDIPKHLHNLRVSMSFLYTVRLLFACYPLIFTECLVYLHVCIWELDVVYTWTRTCNTFLSWIWVSSVVDRLQCRARIVTSHTTCTCMHTFIGICCTNSWQSCWSCMHIYIWQQCTCSLYMISPYAVGQCLVLVPCFSPQASWEYSQIYHSLLHALTHHRNGRGNSSVLTQEGTFTTMTMKG